MIYVVLGMHKSGTTLVSQVLHHSGIAMDDSIDEDVSYDSGNKYERQAVLALNLKMLGIDHYLVLGVPRPDRASISEDLIEEARGVIAAAGAEHADWGFKDPRTALTYPAWRDALPEHRIIAVYRHPGEVWPRFRYERFYYFFKNFGLADDYAHRWYDHNAGLLEYLAETDQEYLLLSYEKLMSTQEEFERLRRFTGRDLEDRRDLSMYRSKQREFLHLDAAEKRLKREYGRTNAEVYAELEALRERRVAEGL